MKEIKLTQDRSAWVDDADFEWLNQWKWSFSGHKNRGHGYAVRRVYPNGRYQKGVTILLHRLIMNPGQGEEVDHIDSNTMNCSRTNLRLCTRAQNVKNKSMRSDNKSGYKGVIWYRRNHKWGAYIGFDNSKLFLGLYDDKIEAAKAYDKAAKKHHGKFARLNFPEE